MNHLRDLLETLKQTQFTKPSNSGTHPEVMNSWARLTSIGGEEAQCFWLGDMQRALDYQVIDDLCILPFRTCWFELAHEDESGPANIGLLAIQGADEFRAFAWVRRRSAWYLLLHYKGKSIADKEMAVWRAKETLTKFEWTFPIMAVRCFLSALHCTNVKRQEHTPDAALQRARSKRGKAPLFSYWTLQLNGKSERGDDQGGTHASPRVHLRRGHPRQFAPGKWTWVQAHAVGNKAAGMVHKDYRAGPAMVAAAQ